MQSDYRTEWSPCSLWEEVGTMTDQLKWPEESRKAHVRKQTPASPCQILIFYRLALGVAHCKPVKITEQ